MDWIQLCVFVVTIGGFLVTICGLFFWSRSESRADVRRIEDLIISIAKEMKDFHGRLCTLEERYLQIITRRE
jgi:hypothetical protein